MKKTILSILSALFIFAVSACGNGAGGTGYTGGEPGTVSKSKTPENGAVRFVCEVLDLQYADVLAHSNITDKTFITADDMETYVSSGEYKVINTLTGYSVDTAEIAVNGTKDATVRVTLKKGDGSEAVTESVLVRMAQPDGEWVPDLSGAVVTDWKIRTTGGAQLYINGIKAPESFVTGQAGNVKVQDVYTIPAVGKNKVLITVKVKDFQDYTMEAAPSKNSADESKYVDALAVVPDSEVDKACADIKSIWNEAYTDFVGGADVTELKKYFASDADGDLPENLAKWFTAIRKATSAQDVDHRITNIGAPKSNKETSKSYFIREDMVYVCFGYRLEWRWTFVIGGANSMTKMSRIYLKNENGSYKIYKVPDEALFTLDNEFYNEWK
ncbi:MAG: hypothetical protein LBQ48_01180 [Oscillospiraceae bacterium]|jgi:hypothetical protein|nr:hypothetical protein [Oscillospiraceae bacterium]